MSDQESKIEQLIAAKKKKEGEAAKRSATAKDEHEVRVRAWAKVKKDVVSPVLAHYVKWLKDRGVDSHTGMRDPSDTSRSGVCLFLSSSMETRPLFKPFFSVSPDYNLETVGFSASSHDPTGASSIATRLKMSEVTKEAITEALLKFLERHFKKG